MDEETYVLAFGRALAVKAREYREEVVTETGAAPTELVMTNGELHAVQVAEPDGYAMEVTGPRIFGMRVRVTPDLERGFRDLLMRRERMRWRER